MNGVTGMKRILNLLLILSVIAGMMCSVVNAEEQGSETQIFTAVDSAAEAAQSSTTIYMYALDGDGVRHYMRQVDSAANSSHGYAEKVGTTSSYSLYTTTDIDAAEPYCVVETECEGATEYLLQYYDAVGNKNYILYLMKAGAGPNSPTGTVTHAKHHFLWDEENQYFYQLEGDVVYVLVMKNMEATYDATSTLPGMTQNEWRITSAPAAELGTEGVYPVVLAYHSHSYSVPVQIAGNVLNHRLDCACGSKGTELEAHSFSEDGLCVCGKREAYALNEGIYYLTGAINGTTYYFRKTGTGESVQHTEPYSLCTTAEQSAATLVDVIQEQTGGFSLAYPYNSTSARIYVYDIGTDGAVDTGVNTKNAEAYHHFLWDEDNAVLYQNEGDVKYVLAFKEMKNSNTSTNEIRVVAVPESELSDTVVSAKLEVHSEHTCDTWIIDEPATAEATGLKHGTCSVCGREVQEVIPVRKPAFCGTSITLKENFAINFYVEEDLFADGYYKDLRVVFSFNGEETEVTDYTQSENGYVFTLDGIVAGELNAEVTATLHATAADGTPYSVSTAYSVAEYCYSQLNNDDTADELRTLLVDLLQYGAATQLYADADTAEAELVTARLTDEQRAWGTAGDVRDLVSYKGVSGAVEKTEADWYGVSLIMTGSVNMRAYFTAESTEGLSVRVESESGNAWEMTADDIVPRDDFYYVDFGELDPTQMSEKISFTVYRGEETVSKTLNYSVESYAANKIGSSKTPLVELVTAVIRYGDAANAYVDSLARVYDLQEQVRYLGRTYETDGTQWFNWSASGFSVRFRGSGVQAKIVSNAPDEKNLAYLKVYVDGVEQEDILLDAQSQTVTLAEGLDPEQEHTVEVRKRTSARSSTAGVKNIRLLDGEILAPENAKEKLIEFVGDSLTVGYSAADVNKTQKAWSTATEDATKTYSKQVADAFGADYMVTAISGRGVVMNNSGGSGYLFPEIYPELDIYNNPGVAYDFALQPDVIVINLGTNDATNATLDIDSFETGMYDFLADVRQKNPNAEVICAYGMRTDTMTEEVTAAIKEVVQQLNSEGDDGFYYLQLDKAADMHLNHPTASAYIPSGEKLIEKIRQITGW